MKTNKALRRRGLRETHELKPIRGVSGLLNLPDDQMVVHGQHLPKTMREVRKMKFGDVQKLEKEQGWFFYDNIESGNAAE